MSRLSNADSVATLIPMQNEIIFLTHLFVILGATFGAFLVDKHALRALVGIYVVLANLFVAKQMVLGGLIACGGGMYMVGSICGLLLLQTVWGEQFARRTLYASFAMTLLFFILSWFQCAYLPSMTDGTHHLFATVLGRVPRITLASLIAHFISQAFTLLLQATLLRLTQRRGLFVISTVAMMLGQFLDSALFFSGSFYGDVALSVIGQMVLVSIGIKTVMILVSSGLVVLAQRCKERGYV